MTLKRPFKYGKITLPSNIFCAPLAGCSDVPFRKMTAKYRPGLIFCEMIKMDALIRHVPQTFRYLEYDKSMHPIGAQLCGSKPEIAGECARMVENLGFDVVDLNCGCPVDKITKDGSGSGMLKNPELIGEIISNMVAAVKIPVTVKIRVGWDAHSIVAPEVCRIAEQAGATAVCIHGRTRSQAYRGPANWDYIRECKAAAKNIIIIGNGDITDALSAERIFKHTGCDAILVARGTMGQPWIIEDIYRHFSNEPQALRSGLDLRDNLMEHFNYIVDYQPEEKKCVFDLRRVGCWFLKKGRNMRSLRESINRAKTVEEIREFLVNYPWHDCDLSSPDQEEAEDGAESDGVQSESC